MADFDFDVLVIGVRPRRLCRRDPRGAARPQDRLRRGARDARRDLPQRRLHPVQGDAPRVGIL